LIALATVTVAKYNPSWLIPMVSHHGDGSHKSGC